MEPHERIILSVDGFSRLGEALAAIRALSVPGAIIKVKALADKFGTLVSETLADEGYRPFIDFKIYDTPDAAAERVAVWRNARAEFFTVHANGRYEMMKKCVAAAAARDTMKILAVTILTSFDRSDSTSLFLRHPDAVVKQFAHEAKNAGVHGIVASPQEARSLREVASFNLSPSLIVTPGIRPVWASRDDQKRTATPAEAIRAGADYLVIGRPISHPPKEIGSPREAFERIVAEIASATIASATSLPVDNHP